MECDSSKSGGWSCPGCRPKLRGQLLGYLAMCALIAAVINLVIAQWSP